MAQKCACISRESIPHDEIASSKTMYSATLPSKTTISPISHTSPSIILTRIVAILYRITIILYRAAAILVRIMAILYRTAAILIRITVILYNTGEILYRIRANRYRTAAIRYRITVILYSIGAILVKKMVIPVRKYNMVFVKHALLLMVGIGL